VKLNLFTKTDHILRVSRVHSVILATFWIHAVAGNAVRNEDICGANNGRRVYLELGEKGSLHARNVTLIGNPSRQLVPRFYASISNSSRHYQCSLELITCPSCVIVVVFKHIALSRHCEHESVPMNSPCRSEVKPLTLRSSRVMIASLTSLIPRFVDATIFGCWNRLTREFPALRSADRTHRLRTDPTRGACP